MNLQIEPGTKSFDYLEVPGAAVERTFVCKPLFGPDRPRMSRIPIMIVNGAQEGPNLCIVAGTHACEYPSIDGVLKVYQNIDPSQLRGRLTIVPIINVSAFWTRTPYLNPDDGIDIGSTYASEGSSISYRIGKLMVSQVFSNADYVIDIHGGDLMEAIVPHAGYAKIGDAKVDEASEMMAKAYGTEYVFERLELGAFEKSGLKIPRILTEAGGEGQLDKESTDIHIKGIHNVMKALNMIDGSPEMPSNQVTFRGRYEIFSCQRGIFYPSVEMADQVDTGDVMGEIRDLEGNVLEQIVAPKDGVVLLMMTNPVKHPDDLIFKCWQR